MRHAEIGVDHLLVALDLVGRAVGDLAAVFEHDHAVGQVHHHAHVVLDQRDGGAELLVHVEDEARHVLLLLEVHAGHRLVEQQQLRLHRERAAELDALLQAVGQPADRDLADVLDLEEVDDLLDLAAVLDLLGERRAEAEDLPEEAAVHLQGAAGHDVVERRHAAEQRDVLEGARDAAARRLVGPHLRARLALEGDAAFLRMVEAVDDVEHRGLAGAVRADDGADLALADVERHVGERLHAAERERHVLDRQQRLRHRAVAAGRRSHAAFSRAAGFDRRHVADLHPRREHALAAVLERHLGRDVGLGRAVIERRRSAARSARRRSRAGPSGCGSARRRRRRAPCAG